MASFFYGSESLNERAEYMVRDIPKTFHNIIRTLWDYNMENDQKLESFFAYSTAEECREREFEILQQVSNQVRTAINSLNVSPARMAYPTD